MLKKRLVLAAWVVVVLLLLAPTNSSRGETVYLPTMTSTHSCTPQPATPFGVQMYGDTRAASRFYPLLIGSGASWVRVPVSWRLTEPNNTGPDHYEWLYVDRVLSAARDGCLHMIATLADDPPWAATGIQTPLPSTVYGELAEFMAALVERYDGDGVKDAPGSPVVRYWEIYNEPDDTVPIDGVRWGYAGDKYAHLLAALYPAIKAADPQAQVMIGGIAYDWYVGQPNLFFPGFLDDVLAAGGGAYFDVMNFHTYPPFAANWAKQGPGLYEKTQHIREKLAHYGLNKPIIISESCHHSNDVYGLPGSDELQMRYVVQLYTQSIAAGVEAMIWFALADPGDLYPLDSGLVTNTTPPVIKPAYMVYQIAAQELGAARFAARLTPAETGVSSMEAYNFSNVQNGRVIYVAWLDPIDTPDAQPLSLPAAHVTLRGILGNSKSVEDGDDGRIDGRVNVLVTRWPVYIEMN